MILREVVELVKKNLKTLIRAKTGSLIVILGPLLVIFLAGLAFDNSNVYAVKIGAYRPDDTDITGAFLDQLRNDFKVLEYNSEDECLQAIKNTDINACMIFSPNFEIGKANQNKITFHVDYSRINLVYSLLESMNREVSEEAMAVSQNLTRILLNTLEYTKERVGDQREILIKLTTQNELVNENTQDLTAELGDIDLTFQEGQFNVEEVQIARTQVKQWSENALELGDRGLSKATSFIDAAHALAKQSSGSQQEQLLASFQKTVDDVNALKSDLSKTKELSGVSFEKFDSQINALVDSVSNTKAALNNADTSRQLSLRVLEAIGGLLDKSLLSIIEVQAALNDIDNKISAIEITDPEAITQPIVTAIKPIVQERTYLNYLFPILVVLIIMFTALLITPTLILLDKHSPASFRTYMTPVKDISYVIAHYVTALLILSVQVVIILAISSIFFSGQIITNVPEALLLLFLITSLFILIGMMVGYVFNNEETATLAGVSIGALFLFISDVIIPIESMPEAFAYIAGFNPYVLGSSLLRRALLFDASLTSLSEDILILIGYIIALGLVACGIYLITKKYSLEQIIKKFTPVLARFKRK